MNILNGALKKQDDKSDHVIQVEIVERASVMHFQEKMGKFLKIYVNQPKSVNQLRGLFEANTINFKKKNCFFTTTYESNMPYALRFMIDNKMGGMSWLRIPNNYYHLRSQQDRVTSA